MFLFAQKLWSHKRKPFILLCEKLQLTVTLGRRIVGLFLYERRKNESSLKTIALYISESYRRIRWTASRRTYMANHEAVAIMWWTMWETNCPHEGRTRGGCEFFSPMSGTYFQRANTIETVEKRVMLISNWMPSFESYVVRNRIAKLRGIFVEKLSAQEADKLP